MNTIAWITSKNEQYDIKDIEARKTKLNIEDLPKNLSAFSNDMGFIDNTVNNLINYYKKSETYTKTEIDQKLSAKWDSKFVDELPTEDISTTTIYFLKRKKEQGTTQYESDVYDEYIYTGTWELIGNTYVDLTDYYRKNEVEEVIDNKVLVETNNRLISENEIKGNIENVNNYAKSIENNLNSEISTRQNNDLLHDTKINEVESNLNSEISRATNAENTLSNRCDTYDSHIANIDNPHSVTAEQVGLGNVTNVSTTSTITPDSEKNITSGAVYTALSNKVDKVSGKGLSDQNFTLAEKTKLAGLKNYNDTSISNRVTVTENAIKTLNGNSSVSGSVDKKIADAIAGVTQIDFKIVSSLPSTGIKGTIYLIRGTGTETTQQYNEYIWVNGKWEKLGRSTIEVNLSDIYSKSEVNALVSVKNDKITITDDSSTALTDADTFSTTVNTGTNPTNLTKRPLSSLWNYIKGKISSVLGLTKDNYGGKAATAGTADKTVNDITISVPFVESGQYVIPFGNIPEPTSTELETPYNWDITGFFSIIRPAGHNGSHLWFEAGHGYSHDWTTYAYLDKFDFKNVTTSIKTFQYNGKWWLGLWLNTHNQGYSGKMTITYSRYLPATPTCILYNSRSGGIANEEIYNSIQDIPSSWWKTRTIDNPTSFSNTLHVDGSITPRQGTLDGATVSIGRADGNITIGDTNNNNVGNTVINNDCKMLKSLNVSGDMISNFEGGCNFGDIFVHSKPLFPSGYVPRMYFIKRAMNNDITTAQKELLRKMFAYQSVSRLIQCYGTLAYRINSADKTLGGRIVTVGYFDGDDWLDSNDNISYDDNFTVNYACFGVQEKTESINFIDMHNLSEIIMRNRFGSLNYLLVANLCFTVLEKV